MLIGAPHCASCGDEVRFNPKAAGRASAQFGRPMTGWYHADSNRRDHEAAPHDGRSPSAELARVDQHMAAARDRVHRVLGGQFALLDAEQIVNKAAGGL